MAHLMHCLTQWSVSRRILDFSYPHLCPSLPLPLPLLLLLPWLLALPSLWLRRERSHRILSCHQQSCSRNEAGRLAAAQCSRSLELDQIWSSEECWEDCYEEKGQDRVSGLKTEQQDHAKRADIQTHTHIHEDTYIHTHKGTNGTSWWRLRSEVKSSVVKWSEVRWSGVKRLGADLRVHVVQQAQHRDTSALPRVHVQGDL